MQVVLCHVPSCRSCPSRQQRRPPTQPHRAASRHRGRDPRPRRKHLGLANSGNAEAERTEEAVADVACLYGKTKFADLQMPRRRGRRVHASALSAEGLWGQSSKQQTQSTHSTPTSCSSKSRLTPGLQRTSSALTFSCRRWMDSPTTQLNKLKDLTHEASSGKCPTKRRNLKKALVNSLNEGLLHRNWVPEDTGCPETACAEN